QRPERYGRSRRLATMPSAQCWRWVSSSREALTLPAETIQGALLTLLKGSGQGRVLIQPPRSPPLYRCSLVGSAHLVCSAGAGSGRLFLPERWIHSRAASTAARRSLFFGRTSVAKELAAIARSNSGMDPGRTEVRNFGRGRTAIK